VSTTASEPRTSSGHLRIFIGLAVGIVLGLIVHAMKGPPGQETTIFKVTTGVAEPIGLLFLQLMKMVVLPLVVSALYLAVVDMGDLRRLGRIGLTTLFFTAILSISAVLIGVGLVNVMKPGKAISEKNREALKAKYIDEIKLKEKAAEEAKPLEKILVDIIPENPVREMSGALDASSPGNGMLAVMTFALLCGAAATFHRSETATVTAALRGLYEISMTIIGWAVLLAPIGAGCLIFVVTAELGIELIRTVAVFMLVVIGGLLIQLLFVYGAVLKLFGRIPPLEFFRMIQEAMMVAFCTSSSSATLTTSIKVAQDRLRLSPATSNFVLTVGATGNQNGTALFEGVVVLFLAQAFNVDLSFSQQLVVVLMSVLAGIGTAGVPGGSIPLIIVVLKSVNVPAEGIALVLWRRSGTRYVTHPRQRRRRPCGCEMCRCLESKNSLPAVSRSVAFDFAQLKCISGLPRFADSGAFTGLWARRELSHPGNRRELMDVL
jgi:DAACS family dicarboxylate/amino acid:cation (Na+ or H+) symporter